MSAFEKFAENDLRGLRDELRRSGLDSFQAGLLLQAFLVGKGYGVSHDAARIAAARMEGASFPLPSMQEELEKLAFVM